MSFLPSWHLVCRGRDRLRTRKHTSVITRCHGSVKEVTWGQEREACACVEVSRQEGQMCKGPEEEQS